MILIIFVFILLCPEFGLANVVLMQGKMFAFPPKHFGDVASTFLGTSKFKQIVCLDVVSAWEYIPQYWVRLFFLSSVHDLEESIKKKKRVVVAYAVYT